MSRSKGSGSICTVRSTRTETPWSSCSARPGTPSPLSASSAKLALRAKHTVAPRVINADKNPSYPKAVAKLKGKGTLAPGCELRPVKYLNNLIEQDHRFIKRRVNPGMGFWSFKTAWRTLQGYEAMHQLRKGQVRGTTKEDILSQVLFISAAFGLAA
jgi:transposase, IS6 family